MDTRPVDAIHVTAGVIRKAGKILIARRPPGKHLEGLWEFPGGKREMGETLRKCLIREMREELNIVVEPLSLIMTKAHEYTDKSVILYFFDCLLLSGEPRPVQGQDLKWVEPEELGMFDFPPPDSALIDFLMGGGNSPRTVF
jgi:8-oxo-dGTP diphosphatase